jgi:hypothetical protein
MADLPVACTLTEPELAARRAGVLADVRRLAQETRWLSDGAQLRFTVETETLSVLSTFIDLERRCCAFLRFELTVEPGGGPVWLTLTGPPGTREFLQAELEGGQTLTSKPFRPGAPGPAETV